MEEKIHFTLNGESRTVEVDPETMLIEVIRDVLNLTGTKRAVTMLPVEPAPLWSMAGQSRAATLRSKKWQRLRF